ncbi:MAG: hypothetical protein JSW58_15490, partial [Candidatus Latescibacterota bacterium]
MRHLLVSVLILALAVPATTVFASKELSTEALQTVTPTPVILGTSGMQQNCQVGNLNPPAWAINNFLLPPEEYKLAFDAMTTCAICYDAPFTNGFMVHTVHVLLQTAEACSVLMAVDVEEAVYPTSPDCPEPGPVWCSSGLFLVVIPGAGLWDIGLPISCPCLATNGRFEYLLSFYLEAFSCATGTIPDLITDAGPPLLCHNWNNFGT